MHSKKDIPPLTPAAVGRCLVRRLSLAARIDETPSALVARLEAVQIDPVNLLARNHELALHNRLWKRLAGAADYYDGPERLFEYIAGNRALLPLGDLPFFVPFMRQREEGLRDELARLAKPVRHVLSTIERSGPSASRRIECGDRLSGYWDAASSARTKETTLALQYLWECGRLDVTGREAGECLYDLAERAFPPELLRRGEELPLPEARRSLREKYYRAFLVFDAGHQSFGWQRLSAVERAAAVAEDEARGLIEPLPVEGVRRVYWALHGIGAECAAARDLDGPSQARFLPPLDNLLWRRERLEDLFGFSYRWEIYTPPAKRTGGPYTLPVLYGDTLVGRLDARMDRKAGVLIVERLSYAPEVRPDAALRRAVEEELEGLRVFCRAGVLRVLDGVRL